jgi:hypothetical protein
MNDPNVYPFNRHIAQMVYEIRQKQSHPRIVFHPFPSVRKNTFSSLYCLHIHAEAESK